jgi:hypothetical protein
LPPATNEAIAHIATSPVVKIVLCFRYAFWETLAAGSWRDAVVFNGDGAFPTSWTQLPVRANTLVHERADRLRIDWRGWAKPSASISHSQVPGSISAT